MERQDRVKVTVILEHYPGDERWSASVPLIEGCLAEGSTPEEATEAIIPEIEYFVERNPNLRGELRKGAEVLITEVEVPV